MSCNEDDDYGVVAAMMRTTRILKLMAPWCCLPHEGEFEGNKMVMRRVRIKMQ